MEDQLVQDDKAFTTALVAPKRCQINESSEKALAEINTLAAHEDPLFQDTFLHVHVFLFPHTQTEIVFVVSPLAAPLLTDMSRTTVEPGARESRSWHASRGDGQSRNRGWWRCCEARAGATADVLTDLLNIAQQELGCTRQAESIAAGESSGLLRRGSAMVGEDCRGHLVDTGSSIRVQNSNLGEGDSGMSKVAGARSLVTLSLFRGVHRRHEVRGQQGLQLHR